MPFPGLLPVLGQEPAPPFFNLGRQGVPGRHFRRAKEVSATIRNPTVVVVVVRIVPVAGRATDVIICIDERAAAKHTVFMSRPPHLKHSSAPGCTLPSPKEFADFADHGRHVLILPC